MTGKRESVVKELPVTKLGVWQMFDQMLGLFRVPLGYPSSGIPKERTPQLPAWTIIFRKQRWMMSLE